jgi:hypothetical protein
MCWEKINADRICGGGGGGSLKEGDHFEDLGIGGRVISKRILSK